jgi:hypothetical protein
MSEREASRPWGPRWEENPLYIFWREILRNVWSMFSRIISVTLDGVVDWMVGFRHLTHTHTSFRTTINYSAITGPHTLEFAVAHTHTHTHTHTSVSVFTSQILETVITVSLSLQHILKSSFHSLIPFLSSLLNHLRLPTPETPSVLLVI